MISKHCLAVHEQILRFCLFARIHNTTFLQLSLFHEHAVLIFVLKSKLLSRRFFCSLATVDITDFNILANFLPKCQFKGYLTGFLNTLYKNKKLSWISQLYFFF